ncbi:hypothetical protein M231_03663 [Tremella mesenterica]|uniref:TECPR1-like DysF domain-containing protein n=1 Tax=Tremella mesenterica TaxID=5217 RepID=A0A4Q1BMH6_TREME|nr:uncharacterized protein TREMEDRAFT_74180 [Tremella mesenterica DSM 1558]EIW68836.1 hypothetical protein TREMEDRAFT_74180 [Tremella mesenterica DSM 1558]RXK39039.1 hypothetical protein M231_03663 [Tremella mesenterica]
MTMTIPSYITVPSSATLIIPSSPVSSSFTATRKVIVPSRRPSFPPSTAPPPPTSKKFSVPTGSISANVSDLVLSSLLPPNLPKLPPTSSKSEPGRVKELSSQRESLSVPLLSYNFRRFVTRVGPLFWLQDRVEEVLFWRKPIWTWGWLMLWTFVSFQPRILLFLPSFILIVILLHVHERTHPLPSLLGVYLPPPAAGTTRITSTTTGSGSVSKDGSYTVTTGTEETQPVVPPKEAESGVDFLVNMQAIQNLMSLVSDAYDQIAPLILILTSPSTSQSPTSLPITPTLILLLFLPPTILLPLIPSWAIPYLLLPLGWIPPLIFHPNITPFLLSLPTHPTALHLRSKLEDLAMTDALDNVVGRSEISKVEVWENERFDSSSKPVGWGSKFLRAGERAPWVKVLGESSPWGSDIVGEVEGGSGGIKDKDGKEEIIKLKEGWEWVPGEEWRVDRDWSKNGLDEDGWVYTDDSWQNPSSLPVTEPDPSNSSGGMPVTQKRVTRRRKWYRRVYRS